MGAASCVSLDELKKMGEVVAQDVTQAMVHLHLWEDLRKCIPEFEQEMNQHTDFWSSTIDAHLYAGMLFLSRAFDQEPKSASLHSLLGGLKSSPDVAAAQNAERLAEIDKDLRLVKNSENLVNLLVRYRGSRLAHRGLKVSLTAKPAPDGITNLTLGDVHKLIKRGKCILNRCTAFLGMDHYSCQMIGDDEHRQLLKAVRRGLGNVQ